MKKLIMYIIVIAMTVSTVYFTLIWKPTEKREINKLESRSKKTKDEIVKKIEKETEENKENKNDDGIKNEEKQKESKVEIIYDDENKDSVANMSLLKMDSDDILDNISFIDKAKLVKIGYKLQTVDRKKIEDWVLYSPINIDGARKAYSLLKSRLSSSDFNELEEILNPYVNFDVLGEND